MAIFPHVLDCEEWSSAELEKTEALDDDSMQEEDLIAYDRMEEDMEPSLQIDMLEKNSNEKEAPLSSVVALRSPCDLWTGLNVITPVASVEKLETFASSFGRELLETCFLAGEDGLLYDESLLPHATGRRKAIQTWPSLKKISAEEHLTASLAMHSDLARLALY